MDAARFGRALGIGAREAGKALARAADAASAPNPRNEGAVSPVVERARESGRKAGAAAGRGVAQAKSTRAGVARGSKRFGETMWGPLVKLSGVLWLEVTGTFFGLFVLVAGIEVWRRRADLLAGGPGRTHVWFALAMLVVFGYFTVSSFLKAARRGRG